MPLFACLFLLSASLLPAAGKMTVNGTTVDLPFVYARNMPDTFDPKKTVLYILAVDRELPPNVRTDKDEVWRMAMDGKMNGVEFELSPNGARWTLRTKLAGGISTSRSPNPFALQITEAKVTGTLSLPEPATLGDHTYQFNIPVDTVIEKPVVEPPPTAADRAAAANSPVTKAFLTYLAALRRGDKEGILSAVDPEKAAMARESQEWPQILAMIQSMEPINIVVQKATVTGDQAVLLATGTLNGRPQTGKVTMIQLGGRWLVKNESWKGKQ
jgi:hypothetical protein